MKPAIHGACYCGDLQYELHAPLGLTANCHCGFCRRIHGAPFTTVTFIKVTAFEWKAGTPSVFETPMGNLRKFCPRCASPVCNFPGQGEFASLIVASLAQEFQQEAWFHVNTESKLSWTRLDDGLPVFEGWPEPAQIQEIARAHPEAWLPGVITGQAQDSES